MKAQTQTRIKQLKNQFPVIKEYLRCNNQQWNKGTANDKINIRVMRADENLLLLQPRWLDGDRLATSNSEHEGMLASVHEVFSAVGENHEMLATIGNGNAERKTNSTERVKDLLTDIDVSRVAYLIRMVVKCWHKEIVDHFNRRLNTRRGYFVEREISFVIYRAPRKGFARLLSETSVSVNVRLNMQEIANAAVNSDPTYDVAASQLRSLMDLFTTRVFLNGLRTVINASRKKGMHGEFGDTQLISWVMCGSVMLTFRKGDDEVSFMADEVDGPQMRLQSISATLPDAWAMVYEVISEWEASSLPPHERYKDDDEVSLVYS